MFSQLTVNWNWARILRLLMGVIAIAYGIRDHDSLLGLAGAALTLVALMNIGCCGVNGCGIPTSGKSKSSHSTPIEFEEIK